MLERDLKTNNKDAIESIDLKVPIDSGQGQYESKHLTQEIIITMKSLFSPSSTKWYEH
jgi:hypothetical protein